MKRDIHIDELIEVIRKGGAVKTGVDVFSRYGLLLIDKDVLINNVNTLLKIKESGVEELPISDSGGGGVWDPNGQEIGGSREPEPQDSGSEIDMQLNKLAVIKREALKKYDNAKQNIKQVITDIKRTGGEFDYDTVEKTVTDLLNFLTVHDTAFSYLTKEIFSYDDYLYNHSINVCTIAMAVLNRFNDLFSATVNRQLDDNYMRGQGKETGRTVATAYIQYLPEDIRDIALGFFLHDVGKVLISDEILNKAGKLTDAEFEIIKGHSFEKGLSILAKNGLEVNPFIRNSVQYHHARLFEGEERCYPEAKTPIEIPPYVKICKLADIYDAMTSKRVYKEALNPIVVVTEIFRKYAEKDSLLQVVLHAFVKVVGIYPPGSIVSLQNGQMAYVLDSNGPIILPFTDASGKTIQTKSTPVNMETVDDNALQIDRRSPLKSPVEAHALLPDYLKETAN